MSPLALLSSVWLSAALAAAPVDLTGVWTLDHEASEDMDDILAARGASWMERQAIKRIPVTHHISQSDEVVVVRIQSKVYEREDVHHVDGETRVVTGRKGDRVQVSHRWDAQNPGLVTETRLTLDGDAPGTMTVHRTVKGERMLLNITVKVDDGREMSALRVLKRVAPEG